MSRFRQGYVEMLNSSAGRRTTTYAAPGETRRIIGIPPYGGFAFCQGLVVRGGPAPRELTASLTYEDIGKKTKRVLDLDLRRDIEKGGDWSVISTRER